MKRILRRIGMTCLITICYCVVWMILELIINGKISDNIIDNIMMLLFMPIIFISTENMMK